MPAAAWIALLVAGLTAACAVRFNTFSPWGTDAASYVEGAHRWAAGRLAEPSPLPLWASWTESGHVTVPLGFRPGLATGTDVTEYPPGLSLLMAAALLLTGELGPFLVAPFFAGLLVCTAYALARRLGGPWCGLLAAVLVGASPVAFGMAVQPMSDGPGAALWMLALVMSLRPGTGAAAAAGAAACAAVLVRPNVAPLAAIVMTLVYTTNRGGGTSRAMPWRQVVAAGTMMAVAPLLILWSQHALYGGLFESGYEGGWNWMFAAAHIPKNFVLYPSFLFLVHSPVALAGLILPVLPGLRLGSRGPDLDAPRVAAALVALVATNFAAYLAYWPYEDPHFLRFQLPAVTGLLVLLAGLSAWIWRWIWEHARSLSWLGLMPALVVLLYPGSLLLYPLTFHRTQMRVPMMGRYLQAVLPARAAVLAHLQAGAVAHYTNAPVIRLDRLDGKALDRVVDDLVAHGYTPVLLLSEEDEVATFAARFPESRLRHLEWPPRARAISQAGFAYFAVGDRERFARGVRWPVDVLRAAD